MCEQRGGEENCLFCFFVAATICLSSNNVNCVMPPITSGMHHIAWLGGEVPGTGEPTVLIRVHVSRWHQPAALTYALHEKSSITTLSTGNTELLLNGLSSCWRPQGPFSFFPPVFTHVVGTSNGPRLRPESLSFCCALSSLTGTGFDVFLLKERLLCQH